MRNRIENPMHVAGCNGEYMDGPEQEQFFCDCGAEVEEEDMRCQTCADRFWENINKQQQRRAESNQLFSLLANLATGGKNADHRKTS